MPNAFGHFALRRFVFARHQKTFQLLEQLRLAVRRAFLLQTLDDFRQQCQRPFAVERLVGTRLGVGRRPGTWCPPSASRAKDWPRRAAFFVPATCPSSSPENASATRAKNARKRRARRSSRRDNFFQGKRAKERLCQILGTFLVVPAPPERRRKSGNQLGAAQLAPARGQIAACGALPAASTTVQCVVQRCRPAQSRTGWNVRRSNYFFSFRSASLTADCSRALSRTGQSSFWILPRRLCARRDQNVDQLPGRH